MIGGWNVGNGGEKSFIVIFHVDPSTAKITVKNEKDEIIEQSGDKVYQLKKGVYKYSAKAGGYKEVTEIPFEVTDNKTIEVTLIEIADLILGVRRLISSSSTEWERIEGNKGLIANATKDGSIVQNDFDEIYPWKDIKSCDLLPNGTVSSYIGDASYDPTNPKGYIMTEVPEFYWKREQAGGYEYIYISKKSRSGYTKSEKFYVSRYSLGGTSGTDFVCKSGTEPNASLLQSELRTTLHKSNLNLHIYDIWRHSILQMLYLVEYANYDSQKMLGKGKVTYASQDPYPAIQGDCDSLKMKSGTLNDDGFHMMIYRGIENILGYREVYIDGCNIKRNNLYVCKDPSKYNVSTVSSPYTKVNYNLPANDGCIKTIGYDSNYPEIQFSIDNSGSDNTYIPDYSMSSYDNDTIWAVRVGGVSNDQLNAGLWRMSNNIGGEGGFAKGRHGYRIMYLPTGK